VKILINIYYNDKLIDAYARDVKKQGSMIPLVNLDLTSTIDDRLTAFVEQREKKK
jgi:hypothetical protein